MSLPTVALIGGTGLLGSHFTRCFVSALLDSRLAGVVLVSSQPSDAVLSKAGLKYPVSGVKVCTVKYDDKQAIAGALEGVDVLVNTLGAAREGFQGICETVLDAAVDAGIKVYFPSDFGTDVRDERAKALSIPTFEWKADYAARARQRLPTVVSVYPGLFLETSFMPFLGLDAGSPSPTWEIPAGSPKVAMTSLETLAADVLALAFSALAGVKLSDVRVCSVNGTLDQYADAFERVTGRQVKREYVEASSLKGAFDDARKANGGAPDFLLALRLLMAQGAFDHSDVVSSSMALAYAGGVRPRKPEDFFREVAAAGSSAHL